MLKELELMRRDIAEKAPAVELLETKTGFVGQLESKVELDEVQNALTECQKDIVQQLDEFKQVIQKEIGQSQNDTFKAIDRKADAMDVQQQLDSKADTKAVDVNFAERDQVDELVNNVTSLIEQMDHKCDL